MSQTVYYSDAVPRPGPLAAWERVRNKSSVHWISECFAEALGVFFYVYLGVGSAAGFVIGNILKVELSSLFQIGWAFALGIHIAISICGATSGGHFNPVVTLAMMVFRKFPARKVPYFIVSQILGAYIACALVYYQWEFLFKDAEETLIKAGTFESTNFTPSGLAGAFALYLPPGQSLRSAFLSEWCVCTILAIIIWGGIDPSNSFVTPAVAPVVISMAYAVAIWGFAPASISLNAARDVGSRLWAITLYGTAANGGTYAAIAALVNFPATFFGIMLYEIFLTDSDRAIPQAALDFHHVIGLHRRLGRPHYHPENEVREVYHDHQVTKDNA